MAMGGEVAPPRGKVCVTGAAGFLASWLVKRLLKKGYHVRATVRDPENEEKTAHLRNLPGAAERLELLRADLLFEGSFDAAVEGCEGVFHTAAPVLHVRSDPKTELVDPTVNGTLNFLRSCTRADSIKRIVFTSSSSAVRLNDAEKSVPLDESSWSSPEFCKKYKLWYGLAKTLSEQAAWEFASLHGLNLVVVIPSFVIGPVLPKELSTTAADTLNLLKGETSKFALFGRIGYVHLDDVATAHILVYEHPQAEGRYICSYQELENHELGKFLSTRYPSLRVPTEFPNSTPTPYYTFNCGKIRKLGLWFRDLGWMFDDMICSFRDTGLFEVEP